MNTTLSPAGYLTIRSTKPEREPESEEAEGESAGAAVMPDTTTSAVGPSAQVEPVQAISVPNEDR